jgi:SAM-dependent methyltransferase
MAAAGAGAARRAALPTLPGDRQRGCTIVENPWLNIPLNDYETHMASPAVAQAQMLADIFADALTRYQPKSVAVLGCAGGNGFERVRADVTPRVVGIDINPRYIAQARRRFAERIPELELHVGDLQSDVFSIAPVELVSAGLVFEYIAADAVFTRIRQMLAPGGSVVTVVQLPSDTLPEVTPTPFTSLESLSSIMQLADPAALTAAAHTHGLRVAAVHAVTAHRGKRFCVQSFSLESISRRGDPTDPPAPA